MAMSDPLLPGPGGPPQPSDGQEEFAAVEADPRPDVLPPAPDAPGDPLPPDREHADFVTPRAGDRLTMRELREDLDGGQPG